MKLFVWGTGRLAGKVVGRYIDLQDVEGFIDNDSSKKEYMGKRVYAPNQIAGMEYDAICVANLFCKEIHEQCVNLKLDTRKIIFLYNNFFLKDINEDYKFVEEILGNEYAEIVKNRYHVVRGVEAYGDLCLSKKMSNFFGGGV